MQATLLHYRVNFEISCKILVRFWALKLKDINFELWIEIGNYQNSEFLFDGKGQKSIQLQVSLVYH